MRVSLPVRSSSESENFNSSDFQRLCENCYSHFDPDS